MLQIDKVDILDYDLYLYNCDSCQMIGDSGVFTSPRIDNVSSVSAILESLVRIGNKWKEEKGKGTEAALADEKISEADGSDMNLDIGVFFDNEEIGSLSKQEQIPTASDDNGTYLKRQRREPYHTGAASGDIFDLS